jgi:hypothetical protein
MVRGGRHHTAIRQEDLALGALVNSPTRDGTVKETSFVEGFEQLEEGHAKRCDAVGAQAIGR